MVELVRDLRSTVGYSSGEFKTFAVDCGSDAMIVVCHCLNVRNVHHIHIFT